LKNHEYPRSRDRDRGTVFVGCGNLYMVSNGLDVIGFREHGDV
jgi:hypothetical protein